MATQIKFGGYQGENSVHTRASRIFAAALDKYSQGAAQLAFEPDITLRGHKAADLLAMTEKGELDGCYVPTSYLAGRVPELALFEQLFVVPDRRRAYAILDGVIGERLKRKVAYRTDFKLLGYWDNGLRHVSSTNPIRTLADCMGVAIRTAPNEDHARAFAALGFVPKMIDVRDLPEAVASGVVDAQENSLTNTLNLGINRVHRHVTLTRHLLGVTALVFNTDVVKRWGERVQMAMAAAVEVATAAQRKLAREEDSACAAALAADGVEMIELSEAVRAEFVAATRPAIMETRKRFDSDLLKILDTDLSHVLATHA